MGLGDSLMAAGEAARLYRKTGKRVAIVDRRGVPQWSALWNGIPYITKTRNPGAVSLVNAPGARPYIASKNFNNWTWRPYVPEPAEYVVTAEEAHWAVAYRDMVMIEPNVKAQQHANKAWPWDRWQAVADEMKAHGTIVVQCVPAGARVLDGVLAVDTFDIRRAIAILAGARLFVGTEGALHHAAAAVRTPAVVLWSEFIQPDVTGYATQTNLRHAGPACGMRSPCAGCATSMQSITVGEVIAAVQQPSQEEVTR